MRLFEIMMHSEMGAELQAESKELPDRVAGGSFVGFAGAVHCCPALAEVVMLWCVSLTGLDLIA